MATQELITKRSAKQRTQENAVTKSSGKREEAVELLATTDALLNEIGSVLDVEVKKDETLKLSDLIRSGATQHPQAIGKWYGKQGETCALAAALDGAKSLGLL